MTLETAVEKEIKRKNKRVSSNDSFFFWFEKRKSPVSDGCSFFERSHVIGVGRKSNFQLTIGIGSLQKQRQFKMSQKHQIGLLSIELIVAMLFSALLEKQKPCFSTRNTNTPIHIFQILKFSAVVPPIEAFSTAFSTHFAKSDPKTNSNPANEQR